MHAIITKRAPSGKSYNATCFIGSARVSKDFSLNEERNHRAAVDRLVGDLNLQRANENKNHSWVVVGFADHPKSGYVAIIDLKESPKVKTLAELEQDNPEGFRNPV